MPGVVSRTESAAKGMRRRSRPSRTPHGRDQREEAEQDGEGLAVADPHLAAEGRHPEERDVGVEGDRERERAWARRVRVRELERGEGEEERRRRPAPRLLRVLGERTRLRARALAYPDVRVGQRPPRTEGPPDVPEEHREERDTEPEDDVDPRRREVPERIRVADGGGCEHEHAGARPRPPGGRRGGPWRARRARSRP